MKRMDIMTLIGLSFRWADQPWIRDVTNWERRVPDAYQHGFHFAEEYYGIVSGPPFDLVEPALEDIAKQHATKGAQRYVGNVHISSQDVVDPDMYDSFIAGYRAAQARGAK